MQYQIIWKNSWSCIWTISKRIRFNTVKEGGTSESWCSYLCSTAGAFCFFVVFGVFAGVFRVVSLGWPVGTCSCCYFCFGSYGVLMVVSFLRCFGLIVCCFVLFWLLASQHVTLCCLLLFGHMTVPYPFVVVFCLCKSQQGDEHLGAKTSNIIINVLNTIRGTVTSLNINIINITISAS